MRAKRFKEWILEYRNPLSGSTTQWDDARIWFGPDTDFRDLLGSDIWQIRTSERLDESNLASLLQKLEERLEVRVQPIILQSTGNGVLWFSLDKPILAERMWSWADDLPEFFRKEIDLFKSNASGVDRILGRGGVTITTEQLVQLFRWIEENTSIRESFKTEILKQIKQHPNWPEDMTDWALDDW